MESFSCRFAVRQYKAYKLAAGKTAKSILISCATKIASLSIDKVLEITSYDETHLDTIGDKLTALFIIISDTDDTFNFLVAMTTRSYLTYCVQRLTIILTVRDD